MCRYPHSTAHLIALSASPAWLFQVPSPSQGIFTPLLSVTVAETSVGTSLVLRSWRTDDSSKPADAYRDLLPGVRRRVLIGQSPRGTGDRGKEIRKLWPLRAK